ncbi:hypothetical protein STCU_07976 [Strigomonas culicis]|nr:hypothetical protein STCU_07976 [Strigomonas culicis]|eukprot:EPY22983.1 hypothetical protein STCU_07976 [Strigomonas culicis]
MLLLSRVSMQLRLEGRTSAAALSAADGGGGNEAIAGAEAAPAPRDSAGWRRMEDVPLLTDMRRLYAHSKTCFVAPTPLTVEHLMIALSSVTEADTAALQLANRLFLDCDRYVVLPTRTTYTAFVAICQRNDAMLTAVARLQDAVRQLHIPLDAPLLTALLKGLNESGYTQEALLVLGRTQYVPMTVPLFNAALETLLLSDDALACFSLFEAVVGPAELRPDAETYTLLLLACEQSGQWGRTREILGDMQRRRVKGSAQTLNLLLKGLLKERLTSYAAQLYGTMQRKKVPVWPEIDEAVRHHTKRLTRT